MILMSLSIEKIHIIFSNFFIFRVDIAFSSSKITLELCLTNTITRKAGFDAKFLYFTKFIYEKDVYMNFI